MTAAQLLRHAEERGLRLSVRGEDRILVRGRPDAIEELRLAIAVRKPEIVAVLRWHAVMTATDVVRAAQQVLRDLS